MFPAQCMRSRGTRPLEKRRTSSSTGNSPERRDQKSASGSRAQMCGVNLEKRQRPGFLTSSANKGFRWESEPANTTTLIPDPQFHPILCIEDMKGGHKSWMMDGWMDGWVCDQRQRPPPHSSGAFMRRPGRQVI